MTQRPSRHSERGAALVEFALVLPLLLVVIAGIVDFGFLFQRYEVVTNAAREGARLASLAGYTTCSGGVGTAPAVDPHVRAYVQQGLALSAASMAGVMPAGAVTITCPAAMSVSLPGGGTATISTVRVQVTYNHSFIMLGPVMGLIGGSWGNTINIVGTSQMRLEVPAAGS